jgi:uncharacterized repeat protein (TIGR03803 family)
MAKWHLRKRALVPLICLAVIPIAVYGQTFTTLVTFNGVNGSGPMPAGTLTQGRDGSLYGTTKFGGANNAGTIFKISPTGVLTTLYSFCSQPNCQDGANSNVGLLLATDGNFYGTTYSGGANVLGVIFKVTPQEQVTTLHAFSGAPTDANNPSAALVEGIDGNLYGTVGTVLAGALIC